MLNGVARCYMSLRAVARRSTALHDVARSCTALDDDERRWTILHHVALCGPNSTKEYSYTSGTATVAASEGGQVHWNKRLSAPLSHDLAGRDQVRVRLPGVLVRSHGRGRGSAVERHGRLAVPARHGRHGHVASQRVAVRRRLGPGIR